MQRIITILTTLNVMFFILHEYDAFHRGEWKMFRFLNALKEKTQYTLFLYLHIPITLFYFYYLWTVLHFSNFPLWVAINTFSILHLIVHLVARKWKSNVFQNIHSFVFIIGWAITGMVNLLIMNYY